MRPKPHPVDPRSPRPKPPTPKPNPKPGKSVPVPMGGVSMRNTGSAMHRHPGGRTCAGVFPVAAFLTVVAMVRHWREFGDLWRETATGGTR